MGVIIKHSLKNIFSKPLRLLVLLICVIFASFTGLMAIDMSGSIDSLFRGYFMKMLGNMDVIAYNSSNDDIKGIGEEYPISAVGIASAGQFEYSHDPSDYAFSSADQITVESFSDMEGAYELSILPETVVVDDETCVVSQKYAEAYDVKEGDTITIETMDKQEIELTVAKVLNISNTLIKGECIIVSNDILRRVSCVKELNYSIWMIDAKVDSDSQAIVDAIKNNNPRAEVESITAMFEEDNDLQQVYNVFYLLFIISFLLVIFVTISLAEKIVNERMSVIGTLRSLGVSQSKTALILLVENALYAVIGGIIGCVLYSVVKPIMFSTVFVINVMGDIDPLSLMRPTPAYIYLAAVLGAVLVECAYPLYELLKAVKTPIRDIIFNNKDTEFKYKWSRLYTGIGLAALSVITCFLTKNFVTMCISLVSGVVALALLVPFLIRLCSKGLSRLFIRLKMPVAQLASENMARNKIIMGTSVLCITSMILSLLIGGVGHTLTGHLSTPDYNCDLRVSIYLSDEHHHYDFLDNIEGVTATDYVYGDSISCKVNGEEKTKYLTIWADTPHTMFSEIPMEGFDLKDNEIVLSEQRAKALEVGIGDEINVTLNSDTDFPATKTFILKDTFAYGDNSDILGINTMIISRDLYEHLFEDHLDYVFLKADDPDSVKQAILDNTETDTVDVKTYQELIEEEQRASGGLLGVLRGVIAGSVALTLIGIAGNQSLGFITRKRETALLYSVAMTRKKLRRLLFLESLFSMGISSVVAMCAAPFLYRVLGHLFSIFSEGDLSILDEGGIDGGTMLTYAGIILAVFLLTTISPARQLRKMKIAEELKYE